MKLLKNDRKGQVLLVVAGSLFFMLAVAALAVDLGMAYAVRTKLNAATDAAAVAAARLVNSHQDQVETEARKFFDANFHPGELGTTLVTFAAIPTCADGTCTVTVNASASLPTYFARFLGHHTSVVGATASTTISSVDLMLVIDCSASLAPYPIPDRLKTAATDFVNIMGANANNRIGLVHFAGGVILDVPLAADKYVDTAELREVISNKLAFAGSTTTEEAMRVAWQQFQNIPEGKKSKIQAIVLFTDGAPNGIVANLNNGGVPRPAALYSEHTPNQSYCHPPYDPPDLNPLLPSSDSGNWRAVEGYQLDQLNYCRTYCRIDNTLPNTDYQNTSLLHYLGADFRQMTYDGRNILNTRCNVNKAARNLLENYAYLARTEKPKPIRIYTIGFGSVNTPEITFCGYGPEELGTNILKRLANVPDADTYDSRQPTGIYRYAPTVDDLKASFHEIANSLLRLTR